MLKRGVSVVFCLLALVSWGFAQEIKPVAVSPGVESGIARVGERCPTFSWSAVGWAVGYRVAVFETGRADFKTYERAALAAAPVMTKDIDGKALSWTPSEPLAEGRAYVWYVQAVDAAGNGLWSEGKTFRVEVERTAIVGLEDRVTRKLRERGVSESVIAEAAGEMRKAAKAGTASRTSTSNVAKDAPAGFLSVLPEQDLLGTRDRGSEVGLNTWYGNQAGAALLNTAICNSFFGYKAGKETTSGKYNTLVGAYAGAHNTTGEKNAFFGHGSGCWNTTGSDNVFLGYQSGFANTTGYENVFVGSDAGQYNETGYYNTFIGYRAGRDDKSGLGNTFVGYEAGADHTRGHNNTFIGYWAGLHNTKGDHNTFIGARAGYGHTEGSENTFLGYFAGSFNIRGTANTFVGHTAGENNRGDCNTFIGHQAGEGGYPPASGGQNVFVGTHAGRSNKTGCSNSFLGCDAGPVNSAGVRNTFFGQRAGFQNATGNENTFIGCLTGFQNISGDGNVFIGYYAGSEETGSNKLYISNKMARFPLIYGDFRSGIVGINGNLGVGIRTPAWPVEVYGGAYCDGKAWVNASSRSLKKDIRDLTIEKAQEALSGLVPVRFSYKEGPSEEYLGFIAEDVPELVATQDRKGMSAMDVVAVLTKVVQEQQKTIDELRKKVEALEAK